MKAQLFLFKNILPVLFLWLILLSPFPVLAADQENCSLCHKYPGLGRIDKNNKKRLFYVNEDSYTHSVHGRLNCRDCHTNVDKFPHDDIEKVDCATQCHLTEPSGDKKFSHASIIEKFNKSVHGLCDKPTHIKYPGDLPTCTYCHENRILHPISVLGKDTPGIAREVINRCLGCHEDEQWARTYYSHLTHRMMPRRSSKTMVTLCTSCHENKDRMERHGLEVTGTYRDTLHWQAVKYGKINAPNCIDCHAPVGYFSHEIMPKDDPDASIHKTKILSTCSNQSGLQQCHPGATAAFAKGPIHPSGVKAHLFDAKLDTFDIKEQIKRGELKPFKSLIAERAQKEMTTVEYYKYIVLLIIKYLYRILIGALISFMIFHQFLDYLATKRELKRRKH